MENVKLNIAVSALVYKDGKFLLLKRNNPPFKWGPPAGRVLKDEKIVNAVIRETKEEANINIKILMPIAIWSGDHEGERLTSLTFLCKYISGKVKVSEEHNKAQWFTLNNLRKEEVTHNIKEFARAQKIIQLFDSKK